MCLMGRLPHGVERMRKDERKAGSDVIWGAVCYLAVELSYPDAAADRRASIRAALTLLGRCDRLIWA
jgi:hypothetical protein